MTSVGLEYWFVIFLQACSVGRLGRSEVIQMSWELLDTSFEAGDRHPSAKTPGALCKLLKSSQSNGSTL